MSGARVLDASVTDGDIEEMFQKLLGRPVGNDDFKKDLIARKLTARRLISDILGSEEYKLYSRKLAAIDGALKTSPHRSPRDLMVSQSKINRALIIGSCLSEFWVKIISAPPISCECDVYSFARDLPDSPKMPIQNYDLQIIQLPLRTVLPDAAFARLGQTDIAGHERLFAHSLNSTKIMLGQALRWNKEYGLLTFVFPFVVPQLNFVGRLMPRYELSNPVHFIEKLNEYLAKDIEGAKNVYFFDVNEIIASEGRKYIQDDLITAFNHGSFISDFDFKHDIGRLERSKAASDMYEFKTIQTIVAGWDEIVSMVRTVRQIDMVKMVVIDLDDTLWRGTIAEVGISDMPTSEGWPKGFREALSFLKRRGVLLAIISKNEESRVLEVWQKIVGRDLSLDDFAIRRINWKPKSENMAEILNYVNLLPENVVYVDDNPMQRSEIQSIFPGVRTVGGTPLTWRQLLLCSAETQVASVTTESLSRTEMVQAQVKREDDRKAMSRAEFLSTLDVCLNIFEVTGVTDAQFPRVMELINKTNQFNTTGRRWTQEECVLAFKSGTRFCAFEVTDRYTMYGLVGVLIVDACRIQQFVMSCRILGLEAEIAAVAIIVEMVRAGTSQNVFAAMIETERNLPCRDVYERCGFLEGKQDWVLPAGTIPAIPSHIELIGLRSGEIRPEPKH